MPCTCTRSLFRLRGRLLRPQRGRHSGGETLRQAITSAEANPCADEIRFDLATPYSITQTSALPQLTQPVTIDATTQPGWTAGTPLVEINGNSTAGTAGWRVLGGSSIIKGLILNRFSTDAILLQSSGDTTAGCWIGVANSGLAASPNYTGVVVITSNNQIGDGSLAGRNVICGCTSRPGALPVAGIPRSSRISATARPDPGHFRVVAEPHPASRSRILFSRVDCRGY